MAKSFSISSFSRQIRQIPGRLPLRTILTVPFIIQLLASTGTVGYLAYRNGQRAVSNLASQLMYQAGARINQNLEAYLAIPDQINQMNLDVIETGFLDIYDLQSAGYLFRNQFDNFNVSYISYGLENGDFIGAGYYKKDSEVIIEEVSKQTNYKNYAYSTDDQGNRTELIYIDDYKFHEEDWYASTRETNDKTWSEVYASETRPGLLWVARNAPIHDENGKFVGVISVDFLLSKVSEFIAKLNISSNSKVFIIEPNGLLIASSNQDFSLIKHASQGIENTRRSIFESEDYLTQAMALYLKKELKSFPQLEDNKNLIWRYQGKRYFILVQPWKNQYGLEWLVVTILPENDFMAEINQNTRTTVLLSFLTLVVAIQVGIWTARWVTNPLSQLTDAAKNIEQGNLNQSIQLNRQDELGKLAQSFNHMAMRLDSSFRELQTLNLTLEDQVQERTQELSSTLEQLKVTQADLIQSEKLAALGQLIAGIAHEINTPLGAIQASIGNIDHSLKESLSQIPQLFKLLSTKELGDFFTLLSIATQPRKLLSSREERQLRRQIAQTLSAQDFKYPDEVASILSKMGISVDLDFLSDLLQHPDIFLILESAYSLSSIQINNQNIQLAVERATKVVFALKAYVRQDQTGHRVAASITDGIDTVLVLYHNQLKQGIEVSKNYGVMPLIMCYPDQLVQVWSNLIMNAIQAMQYKGNLAITVGQSQGYIKVEISDDGMGIPAENIDRIFTPFFTTKPMGEGSGIGLHIVRQILEKHCGDIYVFSQPGHTKFTVKIPIIEV